MRFHLIFKFQTAFLYFSDKIKANFDYESKK
jgi:hypothetical protein